MTERHRPDGRIDLDRVPEFRGPRRTLFVSDAVNDEWLICAWDGSEVRVPTADLAAFLAHCLRHPRTGG